LFLVEQERVERREETRPGNASRSIDLRHRVTPLLRSPFYSLLSSARALFCFW